MQQFTPAAKSGFHVLGGSDRSQAATMVLKPGEVTGGPDNRHPRSDQWLYVVGGSGQAVVGGESIKLATGTLLLIEAGEPHQVQAAADAPLQTINVYTPPAY